MVMTIVRTAVPDWSGMSDLINRQDAINELYNINPSEDMLFVDAIVDMLENLPEKSEQKWIPVTEALPKNNRQVLVYAQSTHFALAKYDEMREADGKYRKQWVTFDAWKPYYTIENVIAWMPLPKPWENNNE